MIIKKYSEFKKCNCGCNNCNNEKSEIKNSEKISENLKYHLTQDKLLTENVFRYGSEAFFELINEARVKYMSGEIELSESDKMIIQTDIGKKGIYNNKEVWLDIPMVDTTINEAKYRGRDVDVNKPSRDSSASKPYKVYVKDCNEKTDSNPDGIKVVRFGSGELRAKINDPEARKRYDARHGCSKGKHEDKCKPGYWSCRLPAYAENLGLSAPSGARWW